MEPREAATILQHFGEEDILGAISPPIFQASNFTIDDNLQAGLQANPSGPPYVYSRLGNPTLSLLERKLARLEGCDAAKALGCGQAAISVVMFALAEQGAHIVCVDTAYGPAKEFLTTLGRFGVSHTLVSGLDVEELLDAIRPETTLVYLESPGSFTMRLQDLAAIAAGCREKKVITAVDNTYASPIQQNPHALGIDVVVHSGSKYLGGHSDINAGAVCANKAFVDRLTRQEINLLGNALAPFPAWLMVRGMRTLEIRIKRHEESANRVAQWLEDHPAIEQVHHVSLESFPQRDLYLRQMRGSTGLFSFIPKVQEEAKLKRFIASLQLFRRAVSWGGYESLALTQKLQALGMPAPVWYVRLFIGLEDPGELIEDIEQALHASELA